LGMHAIHREGYAFDDPTVGKPQTVSGFPVDGGNLFAVPEIIQGRRSVFSRYTEGNAAA